MDFLQKIAETLEVDAIGIDDRFRETPDWCSLKGFGILVTLENDYGTRLDVDAFLGLETVRDLFRAAFLAFAAPLLGVPRGGLEPSDTPSTVPAWDSIMHLRLVMETEERFGCTYPLETVPSISTLEDFIGKSVWNHPGH